MSITWVATPSPLSAKKSMYPKITALITPSASRSGVEMIPPPMDPGGAGLLAVRGLVHPPVIRGRSAYDCGSAALAVRKSRRPRVDGVPQGAGIQGVHSAPAAERA